MDNPDRHDPAPQDAPALLSELMQHLRGLVEAEIALARAEIRRKLSDAGTGVTLVLCAIPLALVGLGLILTALVGALLALGWPLWLAALVPGAVCLVLAALLALVGKSRLSVAALTPQKILSHVRKDLQMLKETTHA
ncbi:protein of unknown function DUF1469 (plasmid) [Dinoroseobacter shibae DFL 12 = DSM 16493]|uniref:Integral membrane protein n=1 Tax=Dinoroseobacter shibae (strain DSM 16493 / NCIMB 14021 / DFL 12) TaxID=398580 RepID=A8LUH2_DINSH|nr:phage holin family protein [Dinoroseobacter shibae]ABV95889.1 protein of unknown function DUF1469 [Dinoroseobacter shibae DFL 12 = DSM 16493]URF49204.1 phage holin family protein [Dinoroseobacter shibae]URF53512.1 phage holin family protein [Dinoroseobacter shibae]